jgi:nitrite reductase (NADH) large subunit
MSEATSELRSVCGFCGVGCGVLVTARDGRLAGVRGDPDHPANRGALCPKGLALAEVVEAPDRIAYPEARSARSAPRARISWDEAIGRVARGLADARGPGAIGLYLSGQLTTEDYHAFHKLAKGFLGTNQVDSNSRLCMSSAVVGYQRAFGADAPPTCYEDLDLADLYVVVGSNLAWCHPVLFQRMQRARAGRRPRPPLVVLDPRRTATAAAADLHVALRPGSDLVFLTSLLAELWRRDRLDRAWMASRTDGFAALEAVLGDFGAARAERDCGVPPAVLERVAALWADARAVLSLWAMGVNQSAHGTDTVNAITNLHLATGQLGRPGAGPFSLTGQPNAMGGRETGAMATLLPGHRRQDDPRDRAEVAALWGSPPLAPDPGRTAVDLFEHAASGGLDVLWIVATNPLATLPDRERVRQALLRTPLVVVQDVHASGDTARHADLLLPAAGWGEKNGSMTNSERRVSRVRRVVAPPGEALPDWQIAARVAARLGFGDHFAWRSEREVWAEHVRSTAGRDLDHTGITTDRLDAEPLQWPCPDPSHPGTARLYTDGRFATASGRARFVVPTGFEAAEPPSSDWPLVLTTARDRDQWHTMTRTGHVARLRAHAPEPRLELAPGDAARLGIGAGDRVRVRSRRGAFSAAADVTRDVPEGVACASIHWSDATAPDACANAATHGALDPFSRQPELKHAAVRLERTGAAERPAPDLGLCACRGVSVARVDAAIANGAGSVAAVEAETGAGGACGSCRADIGGRLPRARDAARAEPAVVVVVGNGMVGHRFVESLLERDPDARFRVIALCEEPRPAYDRVHLSDLFGGREPDDLALATPSEYQRRGVDLRVGVAAARLDLEARLVFTTTGERLHYDHLVLATGSEPFVPPIPGADHRDVFVYRTVEDALAIRERAAAARRGVVIGGGLLGLEAAKALVDLGIETHVVEAGPRLMPRQVDEAGGALLRSRIEALGVRVHLANPPTAIEENAPPLDPDDGDEAPDDPSFADAGAPARGRLSLRLRDGGAIQADLVVISAGIRPRDELAREAGLACGPRGGVRVDDSLATSDPHVYAIGEVALHRDGIYGLVAPGHAMADALAARLTGDGAAHFPGSDLSTRLKLLGVEVASLGDAFAESERTVTYHDRGGGAYARIALAPDGQRLLGAILVGDASAYPRLLALLRSGDPPPARPEALLFGARAGGDGPAAREDALVCSCNSVRASALREAIRSRELRDLAGLKRATRAGTGCGGCVPDLLRVLEQESDGRGAPASLCEHFAYTRQELFHVVQVTGVRTFAELLASHGSGAGCEICKPAVASILASLWNEPILVQDTIQDTNDRFLANIQRGGTYSVVPRVPGGEITPDKLIALGLVARRYSLYCKITGGQRIDLLGARVEQLPDIWRDLVEAGFESGHAYGKAMRTVKSCVGTTWCRFGVQDSTALAIRIEERYRGIRAPHKLKAAVSGCIRECAEAQSKDFGVIATEKGWNLYVCGNGGSKPRHADLLAADLDEETLIRYVDRFLMFYIRTADRLTRTARWLESLPGGLDYLRRVVVDDHLGIAAELERQVQHLVDTYQCEWAQVVRDPALQRRFRHFANSSDGDESLRFVEERGQRRPAHRAEAPLPSDPRAAVAGETSWVPLAAVDEVPRDGGVAVRYGDVQLALFHVASRDAWYACQNRCPHTGDAVLGRGIVGDAQGRPKVACPMHKKTFDLETGAGLSDPEYAIATFPVRVEEGKVYVELPPPAALRRALGADALGACDGGCAGEACR